MSHTAPKKPRAPHQRKSKKTSPLQYIGHGQEQDREALLENIPDAFASVDTEWQVTYLNQQAEKLLGTTREALLGRNVWEVFPLPADSLLYLNAHEAMNKQTSLEFSQFHPVMATWIIRSKNVAVETEKELLSLVQATCAVSRTMRSPTQSARIRERF